MKDLLVIDADGHVRDRESDVWERLGDRWCFEGLSYRWLDLVEEYGPLTDATPGGAE